jgi:hypothetical protein
MRLCVLGGYCISTSLITSKVDKGGRVEMDLQPEFPGSTGSVYNLLLTLFVERGEHEQSSAG